MYTLSNIESKPDRPFRTMPTQFNLSYQKDLKKNILSLLHINLKNLKPTHFFFHSFILTLLYIFNRAQHVFKKYLKIKKKIDVNEEDFLFNTIKKKNLVFYLW